MLRLFRHVDIGNSNFEQKIIEFHPQLINRRLVLLLERFHFRKPNWRSLTSSCLKSSISCSLSDSHIQWLGLTLSDKRTNMFFWNPLIPDTLPDSMKNIIRHDQTSFNTRRFKYCLLSPDMFTYVFRWIDLYYLLIQDISRNIKIYYHILSDISPGVSSDIVMNITCWYQTLPDVLPDIIIYYWIYTRYIVNNCHLLPDISSDISLDILRYITYWYSRIWTPPALWSRHHRRRLCWTLQWWTDHVCVVFVI